MRIDSPGRAVLRRGWRLGLAALALASVAASDASRVFRPVAPEREYYKLRHLMGDGMMPNYKALWSGFRRDDRDWMRQALSNMGALCRESRRYSRPENVGTEDDFRSRMVSLAAQIDGLSQDAAAIADRSAFAGKILTLYNTCQSCHGTYAPRERDDVRKYSPPSD